MPTKIFNVHPSQTIRRQAIYDAAMRAKRYYVYVVASKSRAIYVGMTGFLMARILQHKAGEGSTFTSKYHINRLVYYEVFQHVETAIHRETEIKKCGARRKWRSSKRTIQPGKIWRRVGARVCRCASTRR